MEKIIKVEFTENVKSVVANTKIEYIYKDGETPLSNTEILNEAQALFNEASEYSKIKTSQKML